MFINSDDTIKCTFIAEKDCDALLSLEDEL